MEHAMAVRADNREVVESSCSRAGGLREWDGVVALDVSEAVLAIGDLEVEPAYLAGQAASLLQNRLLLALDEPLVALPHAMSSVEHATLLGLVLAILRGQRGSLLLGAFGADRVGKRS